MQSDAVAHSTPQPFEITCSSDGILRVGDHEFRCAFGINGITDAHTHLDGITIIAGGVLDVLRLYTAKTLIVVTSCITSSFGGGDRSTDERGFTASSKIKATIACKDA